MTVKYIDMGGWLKAVEENPAPKATAPRTAPVASDYVALQQTVSKMSPDAAKRFLNKADPARARHDALQKVLAEMGVKPTEYRPLPPQQKAIPPSRVNQQPQQDKMSALSAILNDPAEMERIKRQVESELQTQGY